MAVTGRMTFVGAKELERKLKELERKVARKIYSRALRKGAKIIQAAAKAKAPVDSGLTKSAIKVRAGKSKRGRGALIQVRVSEGDYQGETFYAAFVEYGHLQGSRKLGSGRTHVPARPFMRPAFDESKEQAARAIIAELKSGIESEAAR